MHFYQLYLSLFLAIFFTGCEDSSNQSADAIYFNGTVYTLEERQPTAEAVAVKAGEIYAVGSNKALEAYSGDETKMIDLKGAYMYPGFIEGHAHIMGIGRNLLNVDLMGTESFGELISKVKERAKETPKGEWIIGRGWHQDKWKKQPESVFDGFPIHDALSEAIPNHPVYLSHASGHMALVNAKAMAIAGITSKTKNPDGGEVIRGLGNRPTGILNETATALVYKYIPRQSVDQNDQALSLAIEECVSNGITSLHQAGSSMTSIDLFRKYMLDDRLKLRLYVMINGMDDELLDYYFESGPEVDSLYRLVVRSVKLYADGALGSRGAWLLEPYADAPTEYGHNVTPMSRIREVTMRAAEAGFQVCTHAIGDRGNREVLNIYEEAINTYPDQMQDHRFRIEHAQHINGEDIPRFAELNVIPAMQAIHMSSDRPWAIDRLGKERIEEGAYVWQKLLKQGSRIVNGTDAPVEPVNPIASYYASVSRKTLKGTPENGYEPDQKMTRIQALRSYTLDAAYGAFQEDVKGSIAVGKLADFTVLDSDLLTIPEDNILDTKVKMTIVGGEIVYRN